MARFIIRRILWTVPVLLGIVLVTFVLARALPGGPFDRAGRKSLPESVRTNLERKYSLDQPLPIQFAHYLFAVVQGDLGDSFFYRGRTVNQIIAESFPLSLQLGVLALLVGMGIGLPAGTLAALKQNTWIDYSSSLVAVVGMSVPSIVVGPLVISVFALWLGWLPAARWGVNYQELYLGFLPAPTLQFWSHAVLPVLTLGIGLSALFARLTRASLLQTLGEDYIRTARAKGLGEWTILLRHSMKNALIPIATVLGPLLAAVVTGSFAVERIFGIPGLGEFFVTSVANRDYPVILGTTLLYSVLLVLSNLMIDIVYAWLDPRIQYE